MLAAPPEPVAETLTGRAAVGWAPPAKRPRTRRKAADPSKPATTDDGGEAAAHRTPGDTALGGGDRATASELMIETKTSTKQVGGNKIKLMAEAICAGGAHYTSASDVTTKHNNLIIDEVESMKNIIGNGVGESSGSAAAGASESSKEAVAFFPGNAFVTDALRTTLAGLDAADLKCVYKKVMLASDRCGNQNRLLISCKKLVHGHGEQSPFAGILTDNERPLVHRPEPEETTAQQVGEDDRGWSKKKSKGNKGKKGKKRKNKGGGEDEDMSGDDDQREKKKNTDRGLSVRAYDRDGRAYDVQLKYLQSNHGYRIIGPKWKVFLKKNGLLVGRRRSGSPDEEPDGGGDADDEALAAVPAQDAGNVHIEVWAFRSPKVELKENGLLLPDHPHGALGLLFLHSRGGEVVCDVGGAGAAEEEVHGAGAAPDGVTDEEPRKQDGHCATAVTQDEDDTGAHEVADGDAPAVVAGAAGGEPGSAGPQPTRVTIGVLEMLAAHCLVNLKDKYRDVDRNHKPEADP